MPASRAHLRSARRIISDFVIFSRLASSARMRRSSWSSSMRYLLHLGSWVHLLLPDNEVTDPSTGVDRTERPAGTLGGAVLAVAVPLDVVTGDVAVPVGSIGVGADALSSVRLRIVRVIVAMS